MSLPYEYHPDMPEDCPFEEAEPVDIIFRAIDHFPAVARDFLSDVETEKSWTIRKKPCKYWGCSVWKTVEAVEHGREVYNHFRESWIVCGKLDPADGQVCGTPTRKQPLHVTFWKVHGVDVSGKFSLAYEPVPADNNDPFDAGGR